MASSSVDKMDMSLDQIIKLQRKEAKQSRDGATNSGGRGRGGIRGRGGRGRGGRGRGVGRPAASVLRRNASVGSSTTPKMGKVGLRANLAARRMLSKGRSSAAGRGRGRDGTTAFQRTARNIVKRAIIQNRRMAVTQRRSIATDQQRDGSASTRRLAADVRRWRNTAKQLQQALQSQQQQGQGRFRLKRFNNGGVGRQQAASVVSDVKQRLGWRRSTQSRGGSPRRGRGGFGNRGRIGQALTNVKGRGTVGQMQSDLMIQNRQVAVQRQRRQQMDYSRGRRQQRIGQARNFGPGITTTSINRLPQITVQQSRGRRGRGGRGRNFNRTTARSNDLGTSFSQGGITRQSLHERFGGTSKPVVRINTNSKRGARGGRRQIFF